MIPNNEQIGWDHARLLQYRQVSIHSVLCREMLRNRLPAAEFLVTNTVSVGKAANSTPGYLSCLILFSIRRFLPTCYFNTIARSRKRFFASMSPNLPPRPCKVQRENEAVCISLA